MSDITTQARSIYDDLPDGYHSPGRMFPHPEYGFVQPRPAEPTCKDCTKYNRETETCDILGEITPEALSTCKSAGYWDCYCKPPIRRPSYRRTTHTGVWADILERSL